MKSFACLLICLQLVAQRYPAILTNAAIVGRDAPVSGYNYEPPVVPFEYPAAVIKPQEPSIDLEGFNKNYIPYEPAFDHQDLGSQHKANRQQAIKRLQVQNTSTTACGDRATSFKEYFEERSRKRTSGRRLGTYTEVLQDQAYFSQ